MKEFQCLGIGLSLTGLVFGCCGCFQALPVCYVIQVWFWTAAHAVGANVITVYSVGAGFLNGLAGPSHKH